MKVARNEVMNAIFVSRVDTLH